MQNIFLIGMPGCGKSFWGRRLAFSFGRNFIDLDKRIEQHEKLSVKEIFTSKGEEYFRMLENKFLQEINESKTVIATGGGTPCFYNNMDLMKEKGLVVWIDVPLNELHNRLQQNARNRPLLNASNADELRQNLKILMQQRESFYGKAHHIIFNPQSITDFKIINEKNA